jgi:hypothetical protein
MSLPFETLLACMSCDIAVVIDDGYLTNLALWITGDQSAKGLVGAESILE